MSDTLKVSVPPFSFTIPSPCGDTPLLNCYSVNKNSLKCHRKMCQDWTVYLSFGYKSLWPFAHCNYVQYKHTNNISSGTGFCTNEYLQMNDEYVARIYLTFKKMQSRFAFLLEIKVANIFKTIFYENITSPVNMEFKIWENVTGKWMFCAKSKEGKWKVRVQQCCSDKNNLSRVLKIKWSKINIQQLGSLMSKNNFCSKFS